MKNKLVFVGLFLFSSIAFAADKVAKENLSARTQSLEKQVRLLQSQVDSIKKTNSADNLDLLVEMYAHGPAVVTSPALGVRRSAEDGNDIMVKMFSINEDLVLLKTRQKMDKYAKANGLTIPERPIIALSGGVEGQVTSTNSDNFTGSRKSDVNLSWAEFDMVGEVSPWATASMIISYDGAKLGNAPRVKNSRLKIDRGFLTIGQLNKFPMYFTIGQVYAPFGSFSSRMIMDQVTKSLGRVKDRMIILGYSKNGLYAQTYGLSGETKVAADNKNIFRHSGFNAGFDYAKDNIQFKIGGSIIGNLAESEGMQSVFGSSKGVENIHNQICGVDGRIKFGYEPFTISAEYIGATKRFDAADLAFNGAGAKPQAMTVEAAVEFEIMGKPNGLSVSYGQTWQALALGLPRQTLSAEYDIAMFKNTVFGLEYRHNINYGWNDAASAAGGLIKNSVSDRHSNVVVAQIGVYF